MKNIETMMKKIIISFLFLFTLIMSFACKPEQVNEQTNYIVEISHTTLSISVPEQKQLTVNVTTSIGEQVDAEIIWSSSDSTIASIDENGLLTALKSGTTTISASYKDYSADCYVTVGEAAYIPTIILQSSELNVFENSSINIEAKISYNGEEYDDGIFSYAVEDSTIAKVENGKLVGVKEGRTRLIVSANWRGFGSEDLYTTCNLIVKKDFIAQFKTQEETNLYTSTAIEGCKDSFILEPLFYENGKLVENSNAYQSGIEWFSTDEQIATVSNGVVTANKNGVTGITQIYYEYTDQYERSYRSGNVTVNVLYPVEDRTNKERINLELTDGKLVLDPEKLEINSTVNQFATYIDGEWTNLPLDNGNVENVPYGDQFIRVYTDDYYAIDYAVCVADLFIYDKEDLNKMAEMIEASKTDAYTFTLRNEATIYKTSGYFVLGDDIDYNWETWTGPESGGFFSRQAYLNTNNGLGAYSAYGFNGVFDGRGHTISNVTFATSRINWNNAKGSMFGAIGKDGRVENVNVTGTMSGGATGVFGSACFGTIEDVQVTMMPHGTNTYAVDTEYDGGVICGLIHTATIKNVVTKVLGDVRGFDACFGVVFATAYNNGNGLTLDNIYSVVTGKYIDGRSSSERDMSWGTQESTAYKVPNTLMGTLVSAGNAGFYTTEEEAKAATGIDVTGFDTNYWTIPATGIPVFKTKAE